jgi:transmembrane protein EpsG
MLNAEIMFIALFGTANYFARLANYFQIFQAVSIPWMLKSFSAKKRKFVGFAIIACYFVYFVVANTVMTPFDRYFAKMPLMEYLATLFQ